MRWCRQCGAPHLRLVTGAEGWTNLFEQTDPPAFVCSNCNARLELFDLTSAVSAFLLGAIALLAVLSVDAHPFWLFIDLLARPAAAFDEMMKDGPLAVFLLPLGIAGIVILLVVLPLMSLGYAVRSTVLRLRNPRVGTRRRSKPIVAATKAAETASYVLPLAKVGRALVVALALNAFVGAAILAVGQFGGGRDQFEGLMEGLLTSTILAGGLLFGVQRWIVGIFFFLLLPVTSFGAHMLLSGWLL